MQAASEGPREWWVALLPILVLVGLMPFCVLPGVFFHFDAAPRACLLLSVTAILLCNGRARSAFRRLRESPSGKIFLSVVALQIVWGLLSSALSAEPMLAFFGTGWRRFGVVTQIAVLLCSLFTAMLVGTFPKRAVWLVRVVAVTGIPAALYGVAQYAGWDPLLHADRIEFSQHIRPPGSFGNPTYYAGYLIFVSLCGIGIAFEKQSPRWSLAGWLAVVCGAFALLLTGTRSAILALVLGAFVLLLRSRPRWTWISVAIPLVFSIAIALFLMSATGANSRARMKQWVQDPWGGPRLLLWRDSLRMARAHLILGIGTETFASEFPRFQSPELARAYPDFFEESAHNIFLDSLLSYGLPGLALLIGASALGILAPRESGRPVIPSVFPACVAAGILAGQFTVLTIPTGVLYFVCIGASVGLQAAKLSIPAADSGEAKASSPLVLTAAAALFAVLALQWSYIDFRWQSIKRRMNAGEVPAVMAEYRTASRLFPPDPGLDLWYSRALAPLIGAGGDRYRDGWQQILEAGQRACATSADRPNALYNLALLRALANDLEGEMVALRLAIQSAPNWYKPHLLLAETLLQAGDPRAARAEARLALELSGGRHPEALQVLESALKD